MKKLLMIITIIGCTKNNFSTNLKYKNGLIDLYFEDDQDTDEKIIPYVIEKSKEGNKKALFVYIKLLNYYPNDKELNLEIGMLREINNLIEYLISNNEFRALGDLYTYEIDGYLLPDPFKAIEYYTKAVELGNKIALNNLGVLYSNGIKGKLDSNANKAIEYYRKCIENGYGIAANNLGILYENGVEGQLEPDVSKAIEYYIKAIELGNKYTVNNLGFLYENGVEGQLEPNADKAIEYYIKAIELGIGDAANNLGSLYETGVEGQLEPNANKAIEYYIKGVELGSEGAANNLGFLYGKGIKGQLEPDANKAIEYYIKAIGLGNCNAAYNLGVLYTKGIEGQLKPEIDKAIEYYIKAIKLGDGVASYNLGVLYENGVEGQLERDLEKAIDYHYKAIYIKEETQNLYKNKNYYQGLIEKLIEEKSSDIEIGVKYALESFIKYNNYKAKVIDEIFEINSKAKTEENSEAREVLNIYISNIKACYGIMLQYQIENDNNSTISLFKHNVINKDHYLMYKFIVDYLESLLDVLSYFEDPNFMINIIGIKDSKKGSFEGKGNYINTMILNKKQYLSLGNIETFNNLMELIVGNRRDTLLDYINNLINNIENKSSDLSNALNEVINIEQQLKDVLKYTAQIRNYNFCQKYKNLLN